MILRNIIHFCKNFIFFRYIITDMLFKHIFVINFKKLAAELYAANLSRWSLCIP